MCYTSVLKKERIRTNFYILLENAFSYITRFQQKQNIHHMYLNGWGNSVLHSSYSFDKSVRCVEFSMTFMFQRKSHRANQMLCNQRPCLVYFGLEKSTVNIIFSASSLHMTSFL